jgi:hypothetical protein
VQTGRTLAAAVALSIAGACGGSRFSGADHIEPTEGGAAGADYTPGSGGRAGVGSPPAGLGGADDGDSGGSTGNASGAAGSAAQAQGGASGVGGAGAGTPASGGMTSGHGGTTGTGGIGTAGIETGGAGSTGGFLNVGGAGGSSNVGGVSGSPNVGGIGGSSNDGCDAPYADELRETLLLNLPVAFEWETYQSGPPNADGWSGCAETPCGRCTVSWEDIETVESTVTLTLHAACLVGGLYNRNKYACTIDLMTAPGATILLEVTAVYSAASRRINWPFRAAPTVNVTWETGADHTCDPFGNFNIEKADSGLNASLGETLAGMALEFECP